MTARGANGYTKNGIHGNARISEEVIEKISEAIGNGNTLEEASASAGVNRSTIRRWRWRGDAEIERVRAAGESEAVRESEELYVDLCFALMRAHARAEIRDLEVISAAAERGDWRAAAWRLERRYPERWGKRRRMEMEHTGTGGGPVRFIEEKNAS